MPESVNMGEFRVCIIEGEVMGIKLGLSFCAMLLIGCTNRPGTNSFGSAHVAEARDVGRGRTIFVQVVDAREVARKIMFGADLVGLMQDELKFRLIASNFHPSTDKEAAKLTLDVEIDSVEMITSKRLGIEYVHGRAEVAVFANNRVGGLKKEFIVEDEKRLRFGGGGDAAYVKRIVRRTTKVVIADEALMDFLTR